MNLYDFKTPEFKLQVERSDKIEEKGVRANGKKV